MKIWLDDIREAPEGYIRCLSVNAAKRIITYAELTREPIEILDLDHDLGDYASDGGDAIKLVLWLAENQKFYPIALHTMNPVGRDNMQAIIDRYWPSIPHVIL